MFAALSKKPHFGRIDTVLIFPFGEELAALEKWLSSGFIPEGLGIPQSLRESQNSSRGLVIKPVQSQKYDQLTLEEEGRWPPKSIGSTGDFMGVKYGN